MGQNCVRAGTCACGLANAPLGHSYGPQYCTAEHPHKYYKRCTRCGTTQYTGGTATKKHGSGKWGSGTCPSCGKHNYIQETYNFMMHDHPHPVYANCGCGSGIFCGNIEYDICSKCREGRKTVKEEEYKYCLLTVPDGDGAFAMVQLVGISLLMEYSETYKIDNNNFISYSASSRCTAVDADSFPFVEIWVSGGSDAKCYDSSGTFLYERPLYPDSYFLSPSGSSSGGYFSMAGVPAYSKISCAVYVKGGLITCVRAIRVDYD